MKSTHRGSPLSTEERNELVRRIDEEGIATLREASGLSRAALLNAAIGLPILPGTRALVRDLLEDESDEDFDEDEESDDDEPDEDEESDDDEPEPEDQGVADEADE